MAQILTNKYNLPDTIVKACANDTHRVAGSVSVTQLIDGPRIRILKKLHDYETDVVDNLYMLMGTALHHILEKANVSDERKRAFILTQETIWREAEKIAAQAPEKADQLRRAAGYIKALIPIFFPEAESRYIYEKTMVMDFGDISLYGTFDLYDKSTGILYDYKFCSVYSWIFPEARDKWKQQTNVYATMLEQEGFQVNGIRVIAFFRDWTDAGLLRNKDYPEKQVMEIPIELRTKEERLAFINKRVKIHLEAENGNIADCTGKDRWAKDTQYAIKPMGAKKAIKVFDDRMMAEGFIEENRHKYVRLNMEIRPGDSVRCEKFCPVSKYCEQRKRELEFKEQNK